MPATRDLAGTVVVITGATAGIGRETARQLVAAGAKVAPRRGPGPYDIVIVRLDRPSDLPSLVDARERIVANGMVWAIWPKGRKEFREDDIRHFGPAAGLVDVKVMSFSDELSGLKLVIPLARR